jgi:hypothetical protein
MQFDGATASSEALVPDTTFQGQVRLARSQQGPAKEFGCGQGFLSLQIGDDG